jgi:methylated-DNA-[protein]-cysteine S-methyltransferase
MRVKIKPGIAYDQMESPVGILTLIASDQGLQAILWDHDCASLMYKVQLQALTLNPQHPILIEAKKELGEYFQGKRKRFDVPLILDGTEFQIQAWQQLLQIPYGQTLSYGEQAARLGDKNKARAVGMANRQNPISIIIPCHRVIGKNGSLTGFGGGLDKKERLLAHEHQYQATQENH